MSELILKLDQDEMTDTNGEKISLAFRELDEADNRIKEIASAYSQLVTIFSVL